MAHPHRSLLFVLPVVVAIGAVLASILLLLPPDKPSINTKAVPPYVAHTPDAAPPIERVEMVVELELSEDKEFIQDLKTEIRQKFADLNNLDGLQLEEYLVHPSQETSNFINDYLAQKTVSLLPNPRSKTMLNYSIRGNQLNFTTNAEYYQIPLYCKGESLDFEILAASNFGLRGYCFQDNRIIRQFGDIDTAYFSTSYDSENDLVAFAIRNLFRIDVYRRRDWSLVKSIDHIAASSIEFYRGDLYIGGYDKSREWDQASVYQYSIDQGKVIHEFFPGKLTDVRGLSFYDGLMAVSDSYNNRIILHNLESGKTKFLINGLMYPNDIHLISHDRMYVADEHHNHVRLINLADMTEVWKSPAGQLKSPGSVHQVQQGKWAGMLLISDTDNNRVILVEPEAWKIRYELSGIHGVMKSVPVFRRSGQKIPGNRIRKK